MEEVMPSRRHSSAMLSSPREPSSTMRIFSSAEKWRRVARRMSLTMVSAGALAGPDVCFIFAPCGYDEPEILRTPLAKSAALRRAIALDGFLVRRSPMSLRQQPVPPLPDDTARIARAAFPRGNPYLLLRDRLG